MPELWRRFVSEDWEGWLRVEEFRDGSDLVVRAEMADIDPDKDVDVTVDEGTLHIRAERKESSEHKDKDTYRSEFRYGAFTRSIPLPAGAKESDIKASYKDGILEVRVPIAEETKSAATKVPINRG
jgi:HSP20 family protein